MPSPAATIPTAVRPVGWHEIAGLTPLMVLIVLIGVYPRPFFDRIRPAVAVDQHPIRRDGCDRCPSNGPDQTRMLPSRSNRARAQTTAPRRVDSDGVRRDVPNAVRRARSPISISRVAVDDAHRSLASWPGRRFVILLPEMLILLLTATVMMTAGAFVRLPAADLVRRGRRRPGRRPWSPCSRSASQATDPYSAVALNDAFSRLRPARASCSSGLVLLALAHDQVDDARAAEFFGSLLMINAGAMLVAAANELVFLFVGLELVSMPTYLLLYLPRRTATHAGGGDQVLLPEHLLVGPAALRPGVPLRPDRGEQPEGPRVPGRTT